MRDTMYDTLDYSFADEQGIPIDLDSDEYACVYRDKISGKCCSDLNPSEFCGGKSPWYCGYDEMP